MTTLASPTRTPGSAPPDPAGGGYAAVLRCPGVSLLLAGTLLGRLPSAMAPTLVLLTQIRTGTPIATAAAMAAAQTLASSLSQVLLARQADRVGHRPVVLAATAASTAVHTALAAAPGRLLTWALVIASGGCAAPLQSCLRSRWPSLVPSQLLPSAHLLDAATNELLYVAAPLLAAGTVYGLGPGTGFLLAAVAGAAGTAAIARRLTPRRPRGKAAEPAGACGRVHPWRARGMARLLGVHAALGGVLGAVPIAGVLLAARAHQPAASGLLAAGASAGSVLAGLAFGLRPWRPGTPGRRLAAASAVMAAGWLPLTAHPLPWTAAAFAVLPGAALVPALASGADLTHHLLPGAGAEASGWLLAALGIGEAAATALAGAHPGTWWPAALAGLAFAFALTPAPRPRPAATPPTFPEQA